MSGVELARLCQALLVLAGREALYATLLFAVVAPLAWLLRRRSPRLCHALWALVLLRLVLPPDLASPLAARSLLESGWRALGGWLAPTVAAVPGAGLETAAAVAPTATPAAAAPLAVPVWAPPLVAAWLLGLLLLARRQRVRRRRVRRLLAAARPVSEDALLAVAERWRRQLGLRRPVLLLTTEADWPPFAAGVLRPVIFLPSVLLRRAEPAVLESVVAHEMVHLRRLDPLWLRLAEAVCLLYYFFPLAWLAARRLAEERERLCDARVLAAGAVAPRTYAGSLLAVLRLHLEGGAAEPAFGHAKRRVAMRIRSILEPPARRPRPLFTLLGAVALALFLLPMAARTQAETVASDDEAAAAAEMTNPLPGRKVTSPFGTRRDPFGTVTQEHRGVDVHVQPGDLVRSSADGVVEVATEHYAGGEHYGTVVIVDHGDDLKSFYSHLASLAVKPGDTVRAGSVLGEAGSTGKVTGPHLHFEIWKVGDPINPADFVTDWQPADDGC